MTPYGGGVPGASIAGWMWNTLHKVFAKVLWLVRLPAAVESPACRVVLAVVDGRCGELRPRLFRSRAGVS